MLNERKAVKPLGTHTALGHLHDFCKWKDIPFLRENEGMLPPLIIAVGSRARVMRSIKTLELRESIMIDELALERYGLGLYGRTWLLLGVMESAGTEFPVAIVETQMGCPSTQIILRELMYYSRHDGYDFMGKRIETPCMQVIRAGTCAGVNSFDESKEKVEIGDILIGTDSFGSIGALIQSNIKILGFMGLPLPIGPGELAGIKFSHDGHHMMSSCSWELVRNLEGAAEELGLKTKTGANFTKDSLYAEMTEEVFASLRDKYGIISTEMEQLAIDVLASDFRKAGIPAKSGLILAAIGAIPGKSFPETIEEKRAAAEAEENIIRIAAGAFSF